MEAKLEFMNWFKNRYISEEDVETLRQYIDDDEKIEEMFGTDLSFEGNKLEGRLGLGTAYMNNYQLCRAVQAFSTHMIRKHGGRVGGSVAVGYDGWEKGKEWAESACRMLLGNGIGTSLFLGPKSTEQLSFAIDYLKLEGGIMITADGDDKDMYGVRFFNDKGEAMDEEDMEGVVLGFKNIHGQSQMKPYVGVLRINSIHRKIGPANDYKFVRSFADISVTQDVDKSLRIAYSPLYGSGVDFLPILFEEHGYKYNYTIKSQSVKDGTFPGLEQPDPTDERVYEKVLIQAQRKDADIALVTNPGLSRFGAAVKTGEGEYRILSQEEIHSMLEEYKKGLPAELPAYMKIGGPSDIYLFIEMMAAKKKSGK